MGHETTDPILLCGICRFALDLFECRDLRYNEEFMAPFAKKIQSLNQMVPYLGGDKYFALLEECKKYNTEGTNFAIDEEGQDDNNKFIKPESEDEESLDEDEIQAKQEKAILQSL